MHLRIDSNLSISVQITSVYYNYFNNFVTSDSFSNLEDYMETSV